MQTNNNIQSIFNIICIFLILIFQRVYTCNPGYYLNTNNNLCEDVNECLISNGGCPHYCTNNYGGFMCSNTQVCENYQNYTYTFNIGCRSNSGDKIFHIAFCISDLSFGQYIGNSVDSPCPTGYATKYSSYQQITDNNLTLYYCTNSEIQGTQTVFYSYSSTESCVGTENSRASYTFTEANRYFIKTRCDGSSPLPWSSWTDELNLVPNPTQTTISSCSVYDTSGHSSGFQTWDYGALSCQIGYDGIAPACSDIDECSLPVTPCGNSKCLNIPGSYICYCGSGYMLSNDSQTCIDVDECTSLPTPCGNSICFNTPGSYYCYCDSGFVLSSNNQTCYGHFITSVVPPYTGGGEVIIYGQFGDVRNNISVLIGSLDCLITFNSSNEIKCIIAAGTGTHNITLTENNIVYVGINLFNYRQETRNCQKGCSNHGTCIDGECECEPNYSTFDCSVYSDREGPNTSIDSETGGAGTNKDTKFQIYVKSLKEIDFNNLVVKEFSLPNNWIQKENSADLNIHTFYQNLNSLNTSKITCTIEEIVNENGKQFTFANTTFNVNFGSLKFSIFISNYTYKSYLNTIQLDFISNVNENEDNNCNSKDTEIDTSNIDNNLKFNFIKLSKNNQILSGRFINKIVSDGKPTFFSTTASNDTNSIIVSFKLPHCTDCLIDPDFSILLDSDFKSCVSSRGKWFLPVVIVVPIVSVSIIIVIVSIFYKKNKVSLKVGVAKLRKM